MLKYQGNVKQRAAHDGVKSPLGRVNGQVRWVDGRLGSDRTAGHTLLELVVVASMLIASAILVMPIFSPAVQPVDDELSSPQHIATLATMETIRRALVSEGGMIESLAHRPDAAPRRIAHLVREEPPEYLRAVAPDLARFNPRTGLGWRGPYLQPNGYDADGQPTLVDGWGNKFQLQVDFDRDGRVTAEELRNMRIVSAGPNGQLETPSGRMKMRPGTDPTRHLTLEDCGDDLVLFLFIPDGRR